MSWMPLVTQSPKVFACTEVSFLSLFWPLLTGVMAPYHFVSSCCEPFYQVISLSFSQISADCWHWFCWVIHACSARPGRVTGESTKWLPHNLSRSRHSSIHLESRAGAETSTPPPKWHLRKMNVKIIFSFLPCDTWIYFTTKFVSQISKINKWNLMFGQVVNFVHSLSGEIVCGS